MNELLGDLSFGGISGFAVGYFCKKFLKLMALIFGGYMASLLYLENRGALTINYTAIWAMFGGALSKISQFQVSVAPLGLAFVGGFILGARSG